MFGSGGMCCGDDKVVGLVSAEVDNGGSVDDGGGGDGVDGMVVVGRFAVTLSLFLWLLSSSLPSAVCSCQALWSLPFVWPSSSLLSLSPSLLSLSLPLLCNSLRFRCHCLCLCRCLCPFC